MEQRVPADWAWIGKAPGAADYGILAASAADVDVRQIAWEYVAGSPDRDVPPDAPWAPPWVTFGTHMVGGTPVLSVSVLYPWKGLDQFGRPVWPRLFVASPYNAIARHRMSYRTLCAAITTATAKLEPSPGEAEPIFLIPRPQSLEGEGGIVGVIHEFGFERLAEIAALLLDNRHVAIVGAARMTLARRLSLLDAIAALLPYGCRVDLTASSAVDRKIQHPFRLVFTDFPGANQVPVPLTGSDFAGMPLETPAARRYHDLLLDKGDEQNSGLARIVSYLWVQRETYALSKPDSAVAILEELDRFDHAKGQIAQFPRAPLNAALAFLTGEPTEVHQQWARAQEGDPRLPGKVLATLLDSGDHRAAAALRDHWDTISEDLATFDNDELNQGQVGRVSRSLEIAGFEQQDVRADWLLSKLLVPEGFPEPWHEPIRFRVRLLRRLPVPAPGELPIACNALRYHDVTHWQGDLVHGLLTAELASEETTARTIRWTSWLCRSAFTRQQGRPDWVEALGFTVADDADPAWMDSITAVITLRPGWLVLILRLARQVRRLSAVLGVQGLDRHLIETALSLANQSPGGLRQGFADALDVSLWEFDVQPGSVASVDVARVVLGDPPSDFPYKQLNAQITQYLDGLARAFLALPNTELCEHIQQRFLDHLLKNVDDSGRLAPAAVQLFNTWISDAAIGPVLARYIKSHDLIGWLMSDSRLGPDFWSWLIPYDRDFEPYMPIVRLHSAARNALDNPQPEFSRVTRDVVDPSSAEPVPTVLPSKFAQAMFNAWRSTPTPGPEHIIAAIASVWTEGKKLDAVVSVIEQATPSLLWNALREFQSLVREYPAPVGKPIDYFARLSEAIWADCMWLVSHDAALGPDYARSFQVMIAAQGSLGVDDYRKLKRIFGPRRRVSLPGRSPEKLFERWQHRPVPQQTTAPASLPRGAEEVKPENAGTGSRRKLR